MRDLTVFVVLWLFLTGIFSGAAESKPADNLLNYGAVITGSSFAGRVNGPAVTVETDCYFDKLADGDPASGWMPIDENAPYEIEFCWRVPITVNEIEYDHFAIIDAEFQVYDYDRFRTVAKLDGGKLKATFAPVSSERFRLLIKKTSDLPAIFELALRGPAQLLPPPLLPDEKTAERTLKITDLKITPANAMPGDTVEVSFKATGCHNGDWALVGFREAMVKYFRWFVNDYRLTETAVRLNDGVVKTQIKLPEYAPPGAIPLEIAAFSADDKTALKVESESLQLRIGEVKKPEVKIAEFPAVSVERRNGQLGFLINGEFRLPFFMRHCYQGGFERFFRTRNNGVAIQYFISQYALVCPRDRWAEHIKLLDMHIRNLLKLRPESYVMVGFDLRSHAEWNRANPEALMRNRNGEIVIDSYSKFGLPSMGSELYFKEASAFLDYALNFFAGQPYAGRLIGYHLWACTRLDAFQGGIEDNSMLADRSKIMIGDFHPEAVAKFRAFLREKYHNDVEALRSAWRQTGVTFESAMIDKPNLAAMDVPSGVFRDPLKSRPEIDYAEFFPTLIGDFHRRLAAHVKEKTARRALVMVHYGALLSDLRIDQPSGRRLQSNNFDIGRMIEDDNIDMYVQAMPYETRHAGQAPFIFQPVGSLELHNRLYLADYDIRTYTAGGLLFGRHRSAAESAAIIKRDFSSLLMHNSGAWISDMSQGNYREWSEKSRSWYTSDTVVKTMKNTLKTFQAASGQPHESGAEIAVVVSSGTPNYEDIMNTATIYRNLVVRFLQEELPFVAAPHDVILQSDLGKTAKKYKFYLFLNAFHLSDAEKLAVDKLKNGGRTLCFFYAPNYVTDKGFSSEAMSDLLGMKITQRPQAELMQMQLEKESPLTRGMGGRRLIANGYGTSVAAQHPEVLTPTFQIDDAAVIRAASWPDGATALGVRDFGTHKVIYSAVPFFNAELMRKAARYAGVHLYSDESILMDCDNRFMIWHNGYESERNITVRLPRPATVIDTESGAVVAENTLEFKLQLKRPDTRILQVKEL